MKGLRPRGGRAWRNLSPRPCRVPFFPGRGTARAAPDVKIFYTSRVRAAFPFWRRDLSAPKYILRWIRHGVKFQWIQGRPPPPFSRAPKMVEAADIDFVISKIQDGIKTGAHFCLCSLEVSVTSLHPPRLCRIAVISIKPTFLSRRMSIKLWHLRVLITCIGRGKEQCHFGTNVRQAGNGEL